MKYMFLVATFIGLAMATGNCPDFPSCHCPGDLCRIGSGTHGDGVCCEGQKCVKKSGSENWVCLLLSPEMMSNHAADVLDISTASSGLCRVTRGCHLIAMVRNLVDTMHMCTFGFRDLG